MCLCAVSAFLKAYALLFNWNSLLHSSQIMYFSKACLCLSGTRMFKYRGVAKGGPVVRLSIAAECKGQHKWGGMNILNDKISFSALNKF